jgi:iron complex outermembrane receptor protein
LLKGNLGIGFKLTHVQTDNTFDFFNVLDGTPVPDINRSNRFVYDEMVNAGYINYNIQVKKWGFQAGLRAEHTDWEGDLTQPETQRRRTERRRIPQLVSERRTHLYN